MTFYFHMSEVFYQGEMKIKEGFVSVNIFYDVYFELAARPIRDAAGCLFHVNRFTLPSKVRQTSLFEVSTFTFSWAIVLAEHTFIFILVLPVKLLLVEL